MKKSIQILTMTLTFGMFFLALPDSFAVKIGSTCKKVNAKSMDGKTPVVCKKNTKGKLVWTKQSSSSNETNQTNSNAVPEAMLASFSSGTWGETLYRWYDISLRNSSKSTWLWMTDYELFLQDAAGNTFENRKITIPPIPPGGTTSFVETTNVRFPLADRLVIRPIAGGVTRNSHTVEDEPTNVGSFELKTTKPFGENGRACLSAVFTVKNNSKSKVLQKQTMVSLVLLDQKQNNRPLAASIGSLPTDIPPGGTAEVDQCYLWHNPSIDPILAATLAVKIMFNPFFRD